MQIFRDKAVIREWSREQQLKGLRVGLVPTMGYLHEGHLSLVAAAKERCDVIVVSIYVNPTQFGPSEDLATYPRDFDSDVAKLEEAKVDAVFAPATLYSQPATLSSAAAEGAGMEASSSSSSSIQKGNTSALGPQSNRGSAQAIPKPKALNSPRTSEPLIDEHRTWVAVDHLQEHLCGRGRPGHFRGVATVVAKLFNIVRPDVAVFGKKDYQQWRIICQMVADLDFGIEVVGADLQRDVDGLARSSRNVRLTANDRDRALSISQSLMAAKQQILTAQHPLPADVITSSIRDTIEAAGGLVEYVEVAHQHSLRSMETICEPAVIAVAAKFGSVRLIDNVEVFL